ncbi:hypothetical protein ASPVEDRAFT_878818 [Aspergillus versicolor CBS 583.65]|uniref:Zn(2)-C6 fungal-type domain-containing protein n=1 Tax=Aspergillus versicolor CBS 583.65 TaxID=1036611 RepID=A0A1L9Q3M0_ASPVE|nr:uncharacterized protein ASPVEDRAFT_878818 [Aspergillus versicolor CBS 583.65]OJJ08318.1 hypothetical protein ASPVEDRAFT_878818 [Aspergillus versicolor CBS 583.65]
MEMEFESWQHPPSTKQKRGYASKFRLSCDSCSKSKVRCNHERPSCQRCHQAGIRCVYSVSRRTGKPPKSARNNEDEVGVVQKRPDPVARSISVAVQTESSTPATMAPATAPTASTNPLHRSSESTLDVFFNYDMPDVGLSSHFLSEDLRFDDVPNDHDDLDQLVQAHGFSEQMINDELGLWNLNSTAHSPLNGVNERPSERPTCHSVLPPSEKTGQINENAPCMQLTSSTLQSLSMPFRFCTTVPSVVPPIVTIDRILDTGRQAITSLYTLLQCTCAQSCSSSMSNALIILKILDSYDAIARSPPSTPIPAMNDTSTSSNSKKNGIQESIPDSQPASTFTLAGQSMVLETPIKIGMFTIHREDERRLILHLLLSELRRVERVVEAFGRRYGGDVFHGALEQFLRSRVHSMRDDLDGILSRE